MRLATRPALLLSTALLLAACGGEDERAAYVEQASAICQEAVAEFEALTLPSAPEGFAAYAQQVVDLAAETQAELAALDPPEEDREALQERVLQPFADVVEEGERFVEKVEAAGTDQTELLPLLSQRPSTDEIDTEFLRSYGLETCADAVEQVG